jgi:hypothetical protein
MTAYVRACNALRARGSESRSGAWQCPAHSDEHPSLRVSDRQKRVFFDCYAGCSEADILAALGWQAEEVWNEPRNGARNTSFTPPVTSETVKLAGTSEFKNGSSKPVSPSNGGMKLEHLAELKALPVEYLASLGLKDTRYMNAPAVRMPYPARPGGDEGVRFRVSVDTKPKIKSKKGGRLIPYTRPGWEDTARTAGYAQAVEGESDCWTGWHHGIPVFGIPGMNVWRREWAAPILELGVPTFVWEEPGAEEFTARLANDLPGLRVMVAPAGIKDISDAHIQGRDVPALLAELRRSAPLAAELVRERRDKVAKALRAECADVLSHPDPLVLVADALRAAGYGGDLTPAKVAYLAMSSRVLAQRAGSLPVHLLLSGPPAAGKSYTVRHVLRLLPPEAYVEIDAGSPRVLIYFDELLKHRALIFGEADSLPAGEDNPAASAVRALLQEHRLHYSVTVRDPETGNYTARKIEKEGPTVLVTTSVGPLGEQLDSRLFTLELAGEHAQVKAALAAQARVELHGASEPPAELVALQSLLQHQAPWLVVVPYVSQLAAIIGNSPAAARIQPDFQRLISMCKTVAVLRHAHRDTDESGRVVATLEDYATVRELLGDMFTGSVTGANARMRAVVGAVQALRGDGKKTNVSQGDIAQKLGTNKASANRWCRAALKGGWLVNNDARPRRYDYDVGQARPEDRSNPKPRVHNRNRGEPAARDCDRRIPGQDRHRGSDDPVRGPGRPRAQHRPCLPWRATVAVQRRYQRRPEHVPNPGMDDERLHAEGAAEAHRHPAAPDLAGGTRRPHTGHPARLPGSH